MRIEPYVKGSLVHVVKRGARGLDIVADDFDRWLFTKSLFYLNDFNFNKNWHRETSDLPLFSIPKRWPERKPLTRILAWTLTSNHFHLLLQEINEGGISKFMQRLCGSMTICFNAKHESKGSIFQGSYKAKTVEEDDYLRYLIFYIQVKNVFELYPGGIKAALKEFDRAWDWAMMYPFSSLKSYVFNAHSPIIDDGENLIYKMYKDGVFAKAECRGLLESYLSKSDLASRSDLTQAGDNKQGLAKNIISACAIFLGTFSVVSQDFFCSFS